MKSFKSYGLKLIQYTLKTAIILVCSQASIYPALNPSAIKYLNEECYFLYDKFKMCYFLGILIQNQLCVTYRMKQISHVIHKLYSMLLMS